MIYRFFIFVLTLAATSALGVRAADDAPAPQFDFTQLCAAFGSGFHAIPGTETCVKVGGRVRADAVLSGGAGASREDRNFTTRSRGTVVLDTRTQTDLGLVRTYLEFDADIAPTD